jgi:hypothetical protein
MMARDRSSGHRRIHPAVTFLIKAFAPGCPTMLRSWSAKLEKRGERVELLFDLRTDDARVRAAKLVRSAGAWAHVAVGNKAIRELTAEILDEDVLNVRALLVRNVVEGMN